MLVHDGSSEACSRIVKIHFRSNPRWGTVSKF